MTDTERGRERGLIGAAPDAAMAEILALMDAADEALDQETYDQFRRDEFETIDEDDLTVTAGTVRKINKVFAALDRHRKAMPDMLAALRMVFNENPKCSTATWDAVCEAILKAEGRR